MIGGILAVIAQADGVAASTQIAVALVTVLCLGAAAVAARVAARRPAESLDLLDDDLVGADLLEPSLELPAPQIVSWYEGLFLVLLLLYALFDRAFAWLHVPGTPLFVGEITLGVGLLAMFSVRAPLHGAGRASAGLKVLLAWMAWGAVLLGLNVITYGFDAVRDSALWYYGLVGVLTVFLLTSDPGRFGRWADRFTRVIPIILVWSPIALVLSLSPLSERFFVPDSQVSLLAHKPGNIGVLAAAILGFIWLVDRERGRLNSTQRVVLSSLAVISIALVGFQNRGGMVASVIGIILMIAFMRSRRGELILAVGAVVVTLTTLAIVTNVTIPLGGDREVSAAQMMDNIGSIVNPDSGAVRQRSTTEWRLALWTAVLDDIVTERPLVGYGPGPDIGALYGVSGPDAEPLRNPHNSHLSVLARMGIVGFGLWVLLWIAWALQLMLLRARLLARGRLVEAGLTAWLIITALVICTNAIFDPTLEGPQVGFFLWTVFGIGAALTAVYSGAAAPEWVRAVRAERDAEVGVNA